MLNLIKQKIKEKLYLKLAFRLNDYYIDRYLNNHNINDLEKLIIYSNNMFMDIDLITKWNFCYSFEANDEYYHSHSFKDLLLVILNILKQNKNSKFNFEKYSDNYSEDELIIISKFIMVVKSLLNK